MDEKDRQFVLVGYFPQTDRRLTPGTKLLLDPVMSASFEISIQTAAIIDPDIFSRHLKIWQESNDLLRKDVKQGNKSTCRAQIRTQGGVTDFNTADVLAQFYIDAENREWDKCSDALVKDLDFWVPKKLFKEHPRANRKGIFIDQLQKWSRKYDETYFDIQWANISTSMAMVRMNVMCHGDIVVEALSEYRFDLIDDEIKIVSIWNHGLKTLALPMLTEPMGVEKN